MSKSKENATTGSTAYQIKENTGNLHKAVPNEKTTADSPNFFGGYNIGGTVLDVSGWVKKSEKGGVYIALSVSPKDMEVEERKTTRESFLAEYLEAKKLPENEGKYLLMESSGTIHADKKGGFYGAIMFNGELIRVTAVNSMPKEGDKAYIYLKKSEGRFSEEEKVQMNDAFLTV